MHCTVASVQPADSLPKQETEQPVTRPEIDVLHLPPLRLPTLVAPRSLSAALRCDGTPLPAATILLLMVLLRVNTSQGHPPNDSAQLCHSHVRPVWVSAWALLKSVEEQQRLHFESTVRRAAPCTTSCCPPLHAPSPCSSTHPGTHARTLGLS